MTNCLLEMAGTQFSTTCTTKYPSIASKGRLLYCLHSKCCTSIHGLLPIATAFHVLTHLVASDGSEAGAQHGVHVAAADLPAAAPHELDDATACTHQHDNGDQHREQEAELTVALPIGGVAVAAWLNALLVASLRVALQHHRLTEVHFCGTHGQGAGCTEELVAVAPTDFGILRAPKAALTPSTIELANCLGSGRVHRRYHVLRCCRPSCQCRDDGNTQHHKVQRLALNR